MVSSLVEQGLRLRGAGACPFAQTASVAMLAWVMACGTACSPGGQYPSDASDASNPPDGGSGSGGSGSGNGGSSSGSGGSGSGSGGSSAGDGGPGGSHGTLD